MAGYRPKRRAALGVEARWCSGCLDLQTLE